MAPDAPPARRSPDPPPPPPPPAPATGTAYLHTHLAAYLAAAAAVAAVLHDSAASVLSKYEINRKWFFLYGEWWVVVCVCVCV